MPSRRHSSSIQGWRIDPNVFETSRGERCRLGECRAGCCSNGIWCDEAHARRVLQAAPSLLEFMPAESRNPDDWFGFDEVWEHADFPSGRGVPTLTAPVSGHAGIERCVFVRSDFKCALHVASDALGLGNPGLKPYDCATYPVLRSEGEVLMDKWSPKRLEGSDCQRRPDAECAPVSNVDLFAYELTLALGEAGYAELRTHAHLPVPARAAPRRPATPARQPRRP